MALADECELDYGGADVRPWAGRKAGEVQNSGLAGVERAASVAGESSRRS